LRGYQTFLRGYLNELNAQVAAQRAQDDAVKQEAAARDRLNSLDGRLQHLLSTIPLEVQAAGLSIVEVQVMLRPPGSERSCCTAGQLGDALRRLAWISEGANKSWCSPTGARPVRVRP
jgi:hypothetical protein